VSQGHTLLLESMTTLLSAAPSQVRSSEIRSLPLRPKDLKCKREHSQHKSQWSGHLEGRCAQKLEYADLDLDLLQLTTSASSLNELRVTSGPRAPAKRATPTQLILSDCRSLRNGCFPAEESYNFTHNFTRSASAVSSCSTYSRASSSSSKKATPQHCDSIHAAGAVSHADIRARPARPRYTPPVILRAASRNDSTLIMTTLMIRLADVQNRS
jgi:hypothetical protein